MSRLSGEIGDRLTLANALATACLLAVLWGGTAVALKGKNRVRSNDIKNERLRSDDIRDGAVHSEHLADRAVTPAVQRRLPAARVSGPRRGCAPQSIADGVPEAMRFAVEEFDPGGLHPDTPACGEPSSRLFAPRRGVYHLGAAVRWPASDDGARSLALRINGQTVAAHDSRGATQSGETEQTVATTRRLSLNDRVEAVVAQTSGADLALAGSENNYLTIAWVGETR